MKVVLREKLEKLGRRGEVVRVADGYGRNYLIPKKLAYQATPGNMKVIEDEKRSKDLREAKVRKDFEAIAARVASLTVSVPKKVGEDRDLVGSGTSPGIA